MTDRELLELAAKAAGVAGGYCEFTSAQGEEVRTGIGDSSVYHWGDKLWNPLDDDGEALRLAVKLRMEIGFEGDNVVFADGNFSEFLSEDPAAATRRAIVRAAAELALSD